MIRTRCFGIRSFAVLALPLALVAAGCSKDKSSDSTTAAAETTVAAAAETTVAAAGDTTAVAASETTAAAAGDTTAAAAAAVKTAKNGKLVVCSDIPYAPFEYYTNGADGDVTGIDVDILNGIAKEVGLTTDYIKTPFDGIFAALAAGSCDMIASSVSITPDRKSVV